MKRNFFDNNWSHLYGIKIIHLYYVLWNCNLFELRHNNSSVQASKM